MSPEILRQKICDFLHIKPSPHPVPYELKAADDEGEYYRQLISYPSDEDEPIPAYLLIPKGRGPFPAIIIHHQHNGERHLGKSEVCGLAGSPLQAFGPALARQGFVILAPDSICFEDRRRNRVGLEPDPDADWLQHYNELCYRLLHGDTLMRKVLTDAARGISLLAGHPLVDPERLGALGHSYGGNTVLFSAALDERIRFACASGSACTYKTKQANGTGIEMAEVIPHFASYYDVDDLVKCVAPRKILLVSASNDKYSKDAELIVQAARPVFNEMGVPEHLEHQHYEGEHALTEERFAFILNWIKSAGRA